MAIGAEAIRSMEVTGNWARPLDFARDRQVGQERAARVHLAQIACPELVEGTREFVNSIVAQCFSIRLLRARLLQSGYREKPMDVSKYEKSLDNRCAALVSRERRAPRAGQNCKPCTINGLRLMSLLSRARGARVSRAARGPKVPFSRPVHRALFILRGVAGATPSRMRCVKCHTRCAHPFEIFFGMPFDVAQGRQGNDAAHAVRLLRARLFRRPVLSNVEGVHHRKTPRKWCVLMQMVHEGASTVVESWTEWIFTPRAPASYRRSRGPWRSCSRPSRDRGLRR